MDENKILEQLNNHVANTMIDHLDIKFTRIGSDFLEATMPITEKTINPAKILHGGALMAIAETVGSVLSIMLVDRDKYEVRGLEINGNHVKSAREGLVTARATIVHKGNRTHVTEIRIKDQEDNLLNISRMTNVIINK